MEITIESVDKQVAELQKKHGAKLVEGEGAAFDPAALLAKVCAIITIAVPILQFAKMVLFFKPTWQKIVQKVIDIATQICPPPETT